MGSMRTFQMLAGVLVLGTLTPGLYAQAVRTWVSGVGDDVNPCSRTAPCKTFAGAISKTAAGGEIDALDPGGFGPVTITKAITIDGGAGLASILAAGTNGIVVQAANTDVVVLRNLSINGVSTTFSPGLNGVRLLAGQQLRVENVNIQGFTQNCIDVNTSGMSVLIVENTTITQCGAAGINFTTTSGVLPAEIDHVRIWSTNIGINAQNGARVTVRNSELSINTTAGVALSQSGTGSEVNLDRSSLNYNSTAISGSSGTVARISNNVIMNNGTGLSTGGGIIISSGDNDIVANVTDGNPNSTFSKK